MPLDILFENAIAKLSTLKKLAPRTNRQMNYECKLGYMNIYSEFIFSINRLIESTPEMKIDHCIYNNNIQNQIINNNYCMNNANDESIFKYNDNQKFAAKYLDELTVPTKNYISKICNIILNDNYEITNETNTDLISLYYSLRILPIYFEVITNCYNLYDCSTRYRIANDINNYFNHKIEKNRNYKMVVDGRADYILIVWLIKEIVSEYITNKTEKPEVFNYILNAYNEFTMLQNINPKTPEKISEKVNNKCIQKNNNINVAKDELNVFFVDDTYNTKKPAYKKDDLMKKAVEKNIIGASRFTIPLLEESIINTIDGKTLKDKAQTLNIECTNKLNDRGLTTAICEMITNTLTNNTKTQDFPKAIKSMVWDKFIGKEKGIGLCYVCNNNIDSKHFELGHIQAKARGGETTIDNLRPVCSLCNKSIGTQNMDEFKKKYNLK